MPSTSGSDSPFPLDSMYKLLGSGSIESNFFLDLRHWWTPQYLMESVGIAWQSKYFMMLGEEWPPEESKKKGQSLEHWEAGGTRPNYSHAYSPSTKNPIWYGNLPSDWRTFHQSHSNSSNQQHCTRVCTLQNNNRAELWCKKVGKITPNQPHAELWIWITRMARNRIRPTCSKYGGCGLFMWVVR